MAIFFIFFDSFFSLRILAAFFVRVRYLLHYGLECVISSLSEMRYSITLMMKKRKKALETEVKWRNLNIMIKLR